MKPLEVAFGPSIDNKVHVDIVASANNEELLKTIEVVGPFRFSDGQVTVGLVSPIRQLN